MSNRKYIRIALSDDDVTALAKAKQTFEASSGVAIKDSLFVLSILRLALSGHKTR